ncbi:MAG: type II toxin-antitoxin system RelE/ParE family toxin [Bacteroidetes bacterium]|nr:type II toxin-antitoxin system RelE/ParE family toxin [Bacteroidota bacterium]
MIREILFWGEYFDNFYNQQELKVRKKIDFVLWLIKYTVRVPVKFLKYLEDIDGLYEIKISSTFKEIRVLCFFDDNKVIVLVNCFLKKSQKTPKSEIELGERLKSEYFKFKDRSKKK